MTGLYWADMSLRLIKCHLLQISWIILVMSFVLDRHPDILRGTYTALHKIAHMKKVTELRPFLNSKNALLLFYKVLFVAASLSEEAGSVNHTDL